MPNSNGIHILFYLSNLEYNVMSCVLFRLYCCITKQNIFLNNIPTFSTDLENMVKGLKYSLLLIFPYIFHIKIYKNSKKKRFYRSYFLTNYFQMFLLVTSSVLYTLVIFFIARRSFRLSLCLQGWILPYEIFMLVLCENLTYHLN